jgi:hypothetical protein
MTRPLPELVEDYRANPEDWELIRRGVVPSTRRRNRGGTSVQELFRHRTTGESVVRHTLVRPNGRLFGAPHFRDAWK